MRAVLLGIVVVVSSANATEAQLKDGFVRSSGVTVSVAELLSQPELFVMEVQFKAMRMIKVDAIDKTTGQRREQLFWYLVYRSINRDLNRKPDESDTAPVNEPEPAPETIFAPDFVLMTNDNGQTRIYPDLVLPEVQAAIARREGIRLVNPVEAVGPVPPVTEPGSADEQKNAVFGVAIFSGVDPATDFFTVFMTGFSNGYRLIRLADGEIGVERKTIRQTFWRPGDEFVQNEREIRFGDKDGDQPPEWIYRPQEKPIGVPKAAEVFGLLGAEGEQPAAADNAVP